MSASTDWPTIAVLSMLDQQLSEGRVEAAQGLVKFWRCYLAMSREQQARLLSMLEAEAEAQADGEEEGR